MTGNGPTAAGRVSVSVGSEADILSRALNARAPEGPARYLAVGRSPATTAYPQGAHNHSCKLHP